MKAHRPTRLPMLLLASLMLALVLAVPLQAQGSGVLEGQVVNGTPGAPAVGAGITVTLHVVSGGSESETRQTTTGAEGRFRFEGLDRDPGLEYWPEATYQDAPYSSAEPVQFEENETITATVEVYESSDDDSRVRLNAVHVIAESFGQVLRISEIQMFGNDGDQTFAGSDEGPSPGTTVFIPLPDEAVGLAFSEEDPEGRYVEAEGGVWDTEPVAPGQNTSLVFLSYHLAVTDGTTVLRRSFAYPVDAFNILVAQPDLALESEQLLDEGLQTFQDREYAFYTTQELAVGEELVLNFTVDQAAAAGEAMPGTEAPTSQEATTPAEEGQQSLLLTLGLLLAGLTVVAAAVYPLVSKRPRAAVPAAARPGAASGLSPRRQRLIAELADLEDARDAGRVDEAAYEQRRAQIYEELRLD